MASHLAKYTHFPEYAGYIVQSPLSMEESTSLFSEINLSDPIQTVHIDGESQLLSLYPLMDMAGEKIGYMGFVDPRHELLAGITHNALLIGLLALGGIATIYISLHLGAARTKRQIAFIAVVAERLSRFDFQVLQENRPTFSNNEKDELKMLSQSLFLMGEELHQHIQALNQLNRELDRKVEEEVEKRQLQEQMLIQQSKMASMGEMIGMIAHQWRQPLHAISLASFSSLDLLDEKATFEENRESVCESTEMVTQNVRFMNETLEHFREFLRPSAEKSWFDLRAAISEVHQMIDPILRSYGISISFDYKNLQNSEKPESLGYPNEFKQVILNLFNNARDAIESKNSPLEPTERFDGLITVSLIKQADSFLLSISDNGGGIPEKIIERIFENHFSTKGSNGTGIGLYMAKTIIEANMGGRLWAENGENGAVFWIELPSGVRS